MRDVVYSPEMVIDRGRLSERETRAGLRAMGRVLEVSRDEVRRSVPIDNLAGILDSTAKMSEMLTRPEMFREQFRPTLERLADEHHEFSAVLTEFDRATRPGQRRRRMAMTSLEDLWIDCAAGD